MNAHPHTSHLTPHTLASMHAFLTGSEKEKILSGEDHVVKLFLNALESRVNERIEWGSLVSKDATTQWYYPAAEYLSDAAMLYALYPEEKLAVWIKNVTLDIVRKPVFDWVGPLFRDHTQPFTGNLETAHICWGIGAVIDLAIDIFSVEEQLEIKTALQNKGILLCERWLQKNSHLANWRGILASGALVAAVALEDEILIEKFIDEVVVLNEAFQPDGSYGESLQYGNYLANALMIAYEALVRKYPHHASRLDISCYAKGMNWMAQSMMYRKPLGGKWGNEERARAINFNDSAAIFRPSGDLLLHVAARYDDVDTEELSKWLFREFYETCPLQGPHDLASFGMLNDWGFLTLPLLTYVSEASSPEKLQLPLTASFSNGNVMVRDRWNGDSVLAIQAGANDGAYAPGHLQGDLNSFMLSYKNERLLADAGHSCYRNIIHGLESATQTHNTCTFLVEHDKLGLQEDLAKTKLLEQRNVLPRRIITNGKPGKPVERGGRLLYCERMNDISLVVSEAAMSYGDPIQQFTRAWLQIASNVTLVIDRIEATQPVKTIWNFLLNNRDYKTVVSTGDNSITAQRNASAVKIFHLGNASLNGPVYAYMHDAYHVEPNQLGEGSSGTGLLYRFNDKQSSRHIFRTHIIIADDKEKINDWQIDIDNGNYLISNMHQELCMGWKDGNSYNLDVTWSKRDYFIRELNSIFTLQYGK